MWDDYSDYGGYSDYSYDYPSYDYSSYSTPSYDYSSYYSQPTSYNASQPMAMPDYSSYMPSYDQSATQYDSSAIGGQGAQYNPDAYNNYSQQANTNLYDQQIVDAFNKEQQNPSYQQYPTTDFVGPADYSSMNQPTSYDSFGNPVAQGSAAAMGNNNVAAQPEWTPAYGGAYTPPADTTYGGVDNSEIGGGFNPGQQGGGDYNYTSGTQVGPTMPGQQQPYADYGQQTRGLNPNTGYGQQPVNYGGYQNPGQGYGGYQQAGAGAGLYGGAQGGQQQPQQGWDWNHPIDSLGRALGGSGTGTGTGTGGSSGGIFDWLGNNLGGLAAGAAGLYALNKLTSGGGTSSGVSPTAGYGAVGGPIAVKAPAVQLQTPTAASNPGNYIGQMGIQGLSPVVPPKV
jgi:hypothetical protein